MPDALAPPPSSGALAAAASYASASHAVYGGPQPRADNALRPAGVGTPDAPPVAVPAMPGGAGKTPPPAPVSGSELPGVISSRPGQGPPSETRPMGPRDLRGHAEGTTAAPTMAWAPVQPTTPDSTRGQAALVGGSEGLHATFPLADTNVAMPAWSPEPPGRVPVTLTTSAEPPATVMLPAYQQTAASYGPIPATVRSGGGGPAFGGYAGSAGLPGARPSGTELGPTSAPSFGPPPAGFPPYPPPALRKPFPVLYLAIGALVLAAGFSSSWSGGSGFNDPRPRAAPPAPAAPTAPAAPSAHVWRPCLGRPELALAWPSC